MEHANRKLSEEYKNTNSFKELFLYSYIDDFKNEPMEFQEDHYEIQKKLVKGVGKELTSKYELMKEAHFTLGHYDCVIDNLIDIKRVYEDTHDNLLNLYKEYVKEFNIQMASAQRQAYRVKLYLEHLKNASHNTQPKTIDLHIVKHYLLTNTEAFKSYEYLQRRWGVFDYKKQQV